VSKHYGALKAVDDVTIAVEDGEALAVIGPNGAGKTTLFNLITGDVAPSKGRIEFGGPT
jgi:branched-chain amino acid transport system ATP-binding protein